MDEVRYDEVWLTTGQNHSRCGHQEIQGAEALSASHGCPSMGEREDDHPPGPEAACWACACFAADSEPASQCIPLSYYGL